MERCARCSNAKCGGKVFINKKNKYCSNCGKYLQTISKKQFEDESVQKCSHCHILTYCKKGINGYYCSDRCKLFVDREYPICLGCGKTMLYRKKTTLYCNNYCKTKYKNSKKPEIITSQIKPEKQKSVLKKNKEVCPYCKKHTSIWEVDHIIPKNKGGLNIDSNLINICYKCNISKSNTDLLEWVEIKGYILDDNIIRSYYFNLYIHSKILKQVSKYLNGGCETISFWKKKL